MTIAAGIATHIGSDRTPPRKNAVIAPKVTISAWAKFDSPVVPNTSDRPTEARPSISPKFKPYNNSFAFADKEVLGYATRWANFNRLLGSAFFDDGNTRRQTLLIKRYGISSFLRNTDVPLALSVSNCFSGVTSPGHHNSNSFKGDSFVFDVTNDAEG
jgi:hypothetical protein